MCEEGVCEEGECEEGACEEGVCEHAPAYGGLLFTPPLAPQARHP